jgi:phosphoglycolate phosphatase-like HAD superfamily hydrolase
VLLLFDIDGTLVGGATDAHRDALYEALWLVHRVDARHAHAGLAPAGRTDGEIARALLLDLGVSAERIDERSEEVRGETGRIYAERATADLSHTVLPGVVDLLDWLAARDRVTLGLLTGNFETVARVKLARAGLARYFHSRAGGFGSDSEDRAALPPIARRRAGTVGHPYPRRQTIVIGDTPRDIACARADDLRCVAVATGPYRVDQLTEADDAVADASGLRGVLAPLIDG